MGSRIKQYRPRAKEIMPEINLPWDQTCSFNSSTIAKIEQRIRTRDTGKCYFNGNSGTLHPDSVRGRDEESGRPCKIESEKSRNINRVWLEKKFRADIKKKRYCKIRL